MPALLYHAMIHKYAISKDYLIKFYKSIGDIEYSHYLTDFMASRHYKTTIPKDISVYFHFSNSKRISINREFGNPALLLLRVLRQIKFNTRSKVRPTLGAVNHLRKQLPNFYFGLSIFLSLIHI